MEKLRNHLTINANISLVNNLVKNILQSQPTFNTFCKQLTFRLCTRHSSADVVFPSHAGPSPKTHTYTHTPSKHSVRQLGITGSARLALPWQVIHAPGISSRLRAVKETTTLIGLLVAVLKSNQPEYICHVQAKIAFF